MELGFDGKVGKFAIGDAELTSTGGQLWNLFEDKTLCDGFDPERQHYTHLAQLIGFIGHPPKALLDQGQLSTRWFDPNGIFKRQNLIPQGTNLADSVTNMESEDKRLFLEFVSRMLQWLPENKELLTDPWLYWFP